MPSSLLGFIIVSAFVAYSVGMQGTPGATPSAGWSGLMASAEVTRGEHSTRVTWSNTTESLGEATDIAPVSALFTVEQPRDFVQGGTVWLFVELANHSDESMPAPLVSVELMQGDFGFGVERLMPTKPWIDAGGSAFYQVSNLYDGSLGNLDWDGLDLIVERSSGTASFDGIRVENDRLYNDRTELLPPTHLGQAWFDADGLYIGSCAGPSTGANTPPGGSLQLSSPVDTTPDSLAGCGFTGAGLEASEELGVGAPITAEFYISWLDD